MKKLLMGSIALTLFSVSILIFQISCKKDATAQQTTSPETVNQLGLIVYTKSFISPAGTTKKPREFWIANIDGTNQRKLPVIIPSDVSCYNAQLSPNGKTIIFEAELKSNYRKNGIYSCSVDGTDFKKVLDSEYSDDTNYSINNLGSVN